MALWKARSLSIEQKVQLVEDDPENESVNSEESVTLIGSEDVSMSEVHSCSVQVPVISLPLYGSIFYLSYNFANICIRLLF